MRCFLGVLSIALAFGQPKLTVSSATAKQVELSWSGLTGPASIERRIAGGRYAPLTVVREGQSYTDAAIDAMAIYQYRVHADAAGAMPSNEVMAGPPAVGYTIPLATPRGFLEKEVAGNFAKSTAMELDSNGDPAFLYSVVDPQFAGSNQEELWFLHWDRAAWKWKAPVKVASFPGARSGVSLAKDPSAAAWATVAESEGAGIELWTSTDDGATWARKHRISKPEVDVKGLAVALAGGQVFWPYRVDHEGVYLLSGALSAQPSAWKTEKLPVAEPFELGPASSPLAVAADAQGRPGVVYFLYGPDYNVTALYWRPGQAARKIQDSNGVQNDFHAAEISYAGAPKDQAKFLVELNRRKTGTVDPEIWVVRDTGSAMAVAPAIPTDGGQHTLNSPFSLAIDSGGQVAALIGSNGGTGEDKCGAPKLVRGPAAGPWKTCSPEVRKDSDRRALSYGLTLRFAMNNKLYGGFAAPSAPLGPGLVLWREP